MMMHLCVVASNFDWILSIYINNANNNTDWFLVKQSTLFRLFIIFLFFSTVDSVRCRILLWLVHNKCSTTITVVYIFEVLDLRILFLIYRSDTQTTNIQIRLANHISKAGLSYNKRIPLSDQPAQAHPCTPEQIQANLHWPEWTRTHLNRHSLTQANLNWPEQTRADPGRPEQTQADPG